MTDCRKKAWILAAAVAALAAIVLVLCLRSRTTVEPAAPDSYARMEDPVYRERMNEQVAARNGILKELFAARNRLQAAEEAGAPEEELAPLREALAACEKDFEDNRQQSMALVRQKLRQQEERNSQLQKQKGQ